MTPRPPTRVRFGRVCDLFSSTLVETAMCWRKRTSRPNQAAAALGALLALVVAAFPALAQQQRDLCAGIEIGTTGVKAVVLEVKKDKDGHAEFHQVAARDFPGNLTAGEVKEPGGGTKFDRGAIERTVEAVQQARDFAVEQKVPTPRIYVAAGSGVVRRNAGNMDTLKVEIYKLFPREGKELDEIDTEKEVKYAFLGAVPEKDRKGVLYVDVGDSHTTFGYVTREDGRWKRTLFGVVPFGASTLLEAAAVKPDARRADLIKAVAEVRQKKVQPALVEEKNLTGWKPKSRPNVYLGGAVPWSMAVLEEVWKGEPDSVPDPGKSKPVHFDPGKIASFAARVGDEQKDPYLLKEPTKEQKVELQKVKDVFPPPRLVAAAELLTAVSEAFELKKKKNKGATPYFVPDSHLARIRGYVEEKYRDDLGRQSPIGETFAEETKKAREEIKKAFQEALTKELKDSKGVLATEIKKAVQEAVAEKLAPDQVKKALQNAVAEKIKISPEEIKKAAQDAVAAKITIAPADLKKAAQDAVAAKVAIAPEDVKKAVHEAVAAKVTPEDIKKSAQEAVASKVTPEEVKKATQDAVAAKVTPEDIKKAAQDAVAAKVTIDPEDIKKATRAAVAAKVTITPEEVKKAVQETIAAKVTITPEEVKKSTQEAVAARVAPEDLKKAAYDAVAAKVSPEEVKKATQDAVAAKVAAEDIKKAAQEAVAAKTTITPEDIKKAVQELMKQQIENPPGPATLTVRVPADARLWVNDALSPLTSETRIFETPRLLGGKGYSYTLRAEVRRNGQTLAATKPVAFRAGERVEVDLRDLSQYQPAEAKQP
jgi:uncharacterized protein (TIGR03000 family)